MSGEIGSVELRQPYDLAVERVDGGSPPVRTNGVRVARRWGAIARARVGLPGRSGEHFLGGWSAGARWGVGGLARRGRGVGEPQGRFGAPAALAPADA